MGKKKRLFWQIFPSYLIIIVISLVAVTWYASQSLRHFFIKQASEDLKARALFFEGIIVKVIDPLDKEKVDTLCKKVGKHASTRITVILPSGQVIGDTETDILAGKSLSIGTIAVLSGVRRRKRLASVKPDYIIRDISQLHHILGDSR